MARGWRRGNDSEFLIGYVVITDSLNKLKFELKVELKVESHFQLLKVMYAS